MIGRRLAVRAFIGLLAAVEARVDPCPVYGADDERDGEPSDWCVAMEGLELAWMDS